MRGVIPMQRSLDAVEQHLLAQRLLDKIESARLNRRDGEGNRAVAGNEDHRDPPAANIQLLLELKPRHLRHLYIEQQATTLPRIVTLQKRQCRREGFHRVSGRAQQESQPSADGRIIIDDKPGVIAHGSSSRSARRQIKRKYCAGAFVVSHSQGAAMPLDDRAADRQAHPHAIRFPDYALSSAIKAWYKTGTCGCCCGFERWRATRCNFKRGSARPNLLFFMEQRISAGRR